MLDLVARGIGGQKRKSEARAQRSIQPVLMRLGERIRTLREQKTLAPGKKKLTQQDAAEKAGLSAKHWTDIERAETNPTVASLIGVSRALGVTLSELFAGVDDHERSSSGSARPRPASRG